MPDAPRPQSVDPLRDERSRRRVPTVFFGFVISLLAFLLAFSAFSPRFLFWPALDLSSSMQNPPEVNRAIDTLRQVDNPYIRITTSTNRVINWRLLFPALGHYLRIPKPVFLALPYLGAVLALWYAAVVLDRATRDRWLVLFAATLAGSTSWFFVSTGWLGYFDSWYVLGLLLASFARSRGALFVVGLLLPWVDERFLLALPLCYVVRGIYFRRGEQASTKSGLAGDLGIMALAVTPYVVIRLIALALDQHESSASHVKDHLASLPAPGQLLQGLWFGLRLAWIFVVIAVMAGTVKHRLAWGITLALAVLVTLAANIALAHDLSRSVSILMPPVLLGMVLLFEMPLRHVRRIFLIVLVGNLLLPAKHVITGWGEPIPIFNLYRAWSIYLHPPASAAAIPLARGNAALERKEQARALPLFEEAIRVNPNLLEAYLQRGICLEQLSRLRDAEQSFGEAIQHFPHEPTFPYFRGLLRVARRADEGAAQDLQKALELSSPSAPYRRDILRKLRILKERAARDSHS